MKKGYYIHFQGRMSIGVSKKIDMQMEEFRKHYDMEEVEIQATPRTIIQRVVGLFPTASITRNYSEALEKIHDPDFLYVRRNVADREYIRFWKEIKRRYPECKIIIEIFTYPYDKDDFGKWNAWPFYIKEIIYRPQLRKYIDRFVTYTKDQAIFGVPTICTTNGINTDRVKKVAGEYKDKQIIMLGVAYMQRQHGYERVIKGLYEYYKSEENEYNVLLYLVGEGPEKKKYMHLVQQYNLENSVKFYPTTTGEELDRLYDEADMALAAFGMYKVAYYEAIGALKTRECLAKGIPILSGSPIDVLDTDYQYAKIFPNDKSAINISEVITFYEAIRKGNKGKSEIADEIRNYAGESVSMEHISKPIIDFIEQQEK